jgi:hypothetical protein
MSIFLRIGLSCRSPGQYFDGVDIEPKVTPCPADNNTADSGPVNPIPFCDLPSRKQSGLPQSHNAAYHYFGEFGATVGLASGLKSRQRAMSNRV